MTRKLPRWMDVVAGLIMIDVVAAFDYITGWELNFDLFYLLPLFWMGWRAGFGWGLATAAASTAAGIAVDLVGGKPYGNIYFIAWEAIIRLGIFGVLALVLAKWKSALDKERQLARTDTLTGALNGLHFRELLEAEMERASRYGRPFTIVYLDMDGFKEINDAFGHAEGDRVLRELAGTILRCLRQANQLAQAPPGGKP